MAQRTSTSRPQIPQEQLRAIITMQPYAFDDTDRKLPDVFKNKIPLRFKIRGKFHLNTGNEGYLVKTGGKNNEWGHARFYQGDAFIDILIPMNIVKVGEKWRPILERISASQVVSHSLNQWSAATAGSVLENFVRSFWRCLSNQKSTLVELGLPENDLRPMIAGDNLVKNVDLITSGFTPKVKELMANGNFSAGDIQSLPRVTNSWPDPGCFGIYLRAYRLPPRWGAYGGQTTAGFQHRNASHETNVNAQNTPHYNIAKKAQEDDRYMIPIIIWTRAQSQSITQEVVQMAEQTVVSMMNCYHDLVKYRSSAVMAIDPQLYTRWSFLNTVTQLARASSGWPELSYIGCNIQSPIFHLILGSPIHCIPISTPLPRDRPMTTYRKAHFLRPHQSRHGTFSMAVYFHYKASGKKRCTMFSISPETAAANNLRDITPIYLVFEIMQDKRPHDNPYLGCPKMGPFKGFEDASKLGIRVEWFDEAKNGWMSLPIRQKLFAGAFLQGVKSRNQERAIAPWRKTMTLIQLLEGIRYKKPLDRFEEDATFSITGLLELKRDHLKQTASWVPRPFKALQPPPERSNYTDNCAQMAALCRNTKTVTNVSERPKNTDDMWKTDSVAATQAAKTRNMLCDLCVYMWRQQSQSQCIQDQRPGYEACCTACSILNRPCTWTAHNDRIAAGDTLRYTAGNRGIIPGPANYHLSFYSTVPRNGVDIAVEVYAPFEGREGLLVAAGMDEGEDESVEGVDIEED
ncbi:unnamed protein product [Clonostachys rosea f. rosea IK726]|uniref:Uncharacterized protein n=1 Tax=Clonostachys rosea f. rosea IK726 TaxID=1349383 RepID=A0ACA9UHV1_BIOOC|nr:unnamed protein product [Clonostachys rosea f. rosea IK726]